MCAFIYNNNKLYILKLIDYWAIVTYVGKNYRYCKEEKKSAPIWEKLFYLFFAVYILRRKKLHTYISFLSCLFILGKKMLLLRKK